MPLRKPSVSHKAPARISASMFYKYDACPHWLYFDAYGDPSKKAKLTAFAEMLLEGGRLHEKEIVADMACVKVKDGTMESQMQIHGATSGSAETPPTQTEPEILSEPASGF